MFEAPVALVETKKQKKIFEEVDLAKVIGYFPDKTCQGMPYHFTGVEFSVEDF